MAKSSVALKAPARKAPCTVPLDDVTLTLADIKIGPIDGPKLLGLLRLGAPDAGLELLAGIAKIIRDDFDLDELEFDSPLRPALFALDRIVKDLFVSDEDYHVDEARRWPITRRVAPEAEVPLAKAVA